MAASECFMSKSGDKVVVEQKLMWVDEDKFRVKIFWRKLNRMGYGFVLNNVTNFGWLSAKKIFIGFHWTERKEKNIMKEKARQFVAFLSFGLGAATGSLL